MAFETSGSLVTDKQTIETAFAWNTQTEWEAFQSKNNLVIESGILKLAETLPTSIVAQYDITQEMGFNDGGVIATLTDFVNNFDLSSGDNPTYETNVQNNNPIVRYDGLDDSHSLGSNNWTTLSQPITFIAVVVSASQVASNEAIVIRASLDDNILGIWWNGNNWAYSAGSDATGDTTSTPLIISAVFNGGNSLLRENGTQTHTGNVGGNSMESIEIGETFGNWPLDGDIGEVCIYDDDLNQSGELTSEESRLSTKWGITI